MRFWGFFLTTAELTEVGVFLIKTLFLCALDASAVNHFPCLDTITVTYSATVMPAEKKTR